MTLPGVSAIQRAPDCANRSGAHIARGARHGAMRDDIQPSTAPCAVLGVAVPESKVVDPGDHAAAQALGTVVLDEDRQVPSIAPCDLAAQAHWSSYSAGHFQFSESFRGFVRRALVDALVVHSADPKARSALHELAQAWHVMAVCDTARTRQP